MPGHHHWPLLLATTTIGVCAHHPRVEISRIDRFRAYLGGDTRGRLPRDLPSRAPIIELQKFAVAREMAKEVAGGAVQGPRGRPGPAPRINKRDFRSKPRD